MADISAKDGSQVLLLPTELQISLYTIRNINNRSARRHKNVIVNCFHWYAARGKSRVLCERTAGHIKGQHRVHPIISQLNIPVSLFPGQETLVNLAGLLVSLVLIRFVSDNAAWVANTDSNRGTRSASRDVFLCSPPTDWPSASSSSLLSSTSSRTTRPCVPLSWKR